LPAAPAPSQHGASQLRARRCGRAAAAVRRDRAAAGFDETELDKLRARKVNGLKQAKEAPRNVVQNYYRAMLFGDSPYAIPASGTVASVSALKQADVQRYYQQYYRPDNAAIIVVGDFQKSEMRKQIESLFGAWKGSGPAPAPQQNGKVKADKARVLLVNKADAIETTFLIGGAGIARNDPDYVPLQVVNTVLGGRFTSWLNDELRVNSGLTYGAVSGFSTLSQTGTFSISSFTASPKTEAALAWRTRPTSACGTRASTRPRWSRPRLTSKASSRRAMKPASSWPGCWAICTPTRWAASRSTTSRATSTA
jgi:predicted Zn-dependent peptidase